jgi:predicted transcriptional regulator with HTH domain
MKKQHVLFLFIGLLLLHACNEAPINNAITCLSTAPSTEAQYLSSVFDSCKIIRLETTEESLVGEFIGKIKKTQDAYYIQCDRKYLLKFDLTGKFLQRIDKIGNGPGEYALFNNYDILSNGDFVILDSDRIQWYDSNWNYKKTIHLSVVGKNIRVINDTKFLICASSQEYRIYLFDFDGNMLSEQLKTEWLRTGYWAVSLLPLGKNNIIYQAGNSNSFICYDSNKNTFSNINFLCDGNFITNEEEIELKKQHDLYYMDWYPHANIINRISFCDAYLFFGAGNKSNGMKYYIMNSENRKIEHVFTDETINNIYFVPTNILRDRLYHSDAPDCFVMYAGVDEILEGLDKNSALQENKQYQKLKQELAEISDPESENPVLIELYVKQITR